MIKKHLLIGFTIGLIANAIGVLLATLIFSSNSDIITSLQQAKADDFLGKLVSIGAVFNLLVFFYFIRNKQDYKARGVILATVFVAIGTFLINYV
ncbi:hypothetical protein SAMN03097699_3187 [Flavobacteriaceae bacterium MAR_2010_188]|nr:hypothetical protein SAMN03097699_3187 [Flavobacteriaceae bacterium MAR_2010_188]